MDLMHGAPQELRFMAISMPPIKDERGKEINPEGGRPLVQMVAEMEEGRASEPAIPSSSGEKSDRELNNIDDDDPGPPGAHPRKFHRRPESLHDETTGRHDED